MKVPMTQLENQTLDTLKRWVLDEGKRLVDINSADLVKTLFGIAGVHPSPIDLTEGVIGSVKGEVEMQLRDHIRKQNGLVWMFSTDFGLGACICKVKDERGVNSLQILLTEGQPGEYTTLRPLVVYNARRVSYYDSNINLSKELMELNNMFKFAVTSDKPAVVPPKEVKNELRKEDVAPNSADTPAGKKPADSDSETRGSRTEGETTHPAGRPAETGTSQTSDGGTTEPERADGDETSVEEESEDEDELTPDGTSPSDAADEEAEETPSGLARDSAVAIEGVANVRESNWLLAEAHKLLQSASVPIALEEFERQMIVKAKTRNLTLKASVNEDNCVVLETLVVELTDGEIQSYWADVWYKAHSDGATAHDQTDAVMCSEFAHRANGRKFRSFERTGELLKIVLNDQTVTFLDPFYDSNPQPPEKTASGLDTDGDEPLPAELKKELKDRGIADNDIKAIEDGKVSVREVVKVQEAMEEAAEEQEAEVNVDFTSRTLAAEVIKSVTTGIKEIFRGYKAQALKSLDFQMEGIRNALEKVIGPKVLEFEWEHRYDEASNTLVINEVVNEPVQEEKEMTIRIDCVEAIPNEDYEYIKQTINENPNDSAEELKESIEDRLDYEVNVEIVKPGEEFIVHIPVEDEEEPKPAAEQTAQPEPVVTEETAADLEVDMSSLKTNDEPVHTDWVDLSDPSMRERVIQVLFPGVTDPAITHLMHFLKDHHRRENTPSFIATKETIPTETTIVYDNLTFAIVKMKDGRFWRIFAANTDHGLSDPSWVSTNHMEDRWFQLGRDIHDNMNFGGYNNRGYGRGYRR